ncbi:MULTISPECIES: N-acetylglucosamine kinase [unclassified Microbacterium]|uniref:N-acetylglucosamine kinase n=1 Tax=unclassified Microbacterium TaxID=2609290 RepID=UPI0036475F76
MGAVSGTAVRTGQGHPATRPGGIVVAVDGGGTKTDAVALDGTGAVVAHVRLGASDVHPGREGESASVVDEAVRRVHAEAGEGPLLRVGVFLSGLDHEDEFAAFRARIRSLPWFLGEDGAEAHVENDMFALLRTGTLATDAVAVVCGTGLNAIGVRADGTTARFLAWGAVSGDWGGGSDIGAEALRLAARALDGRGPETALTTALPERLGRTDLTALIEDVHFGRLPEERLAELVPVVFAAAGGGDVVSRALVQRQAEEIVAMAASAARRLGLEQDPIPVVLGGGVLAARQPLLLDGVVQGLASALPSAVPTVVDARPVVGAGLTLLEQHGATDDVLRRARAALERTVPS